MIAKIILLLPLIGAILAGFAAMSSSRIYKECAKILSPTLIVVTAILSCVIFFRAVVLGEVSEYTLFRWIPFIGDTLYWSLYIDSVTAVMLVVVNVVSAVVHVYSIGYMSGDKNISKFMSFISLFTFFMLLLVTSNNILQLFCGWEGVGMCSYFLIGYWHERKSARKAAIKAFLVNRVSDIFFAIGVFSLYVVFGTLNFQEIFSSVSSHTNDTIEILSQHFRIIDFICILLFIGCMGKSAQILFHTWLPDAMEGPTPVSALIHAATMVTAGVFLLVRCSPLFEYSEITLNVITIVGAVTCVFAATIALVQNDIKRVIAYSTCSQLGYMFFACGVSAYSAAMFHLMMHAFFKALLFLGAGSVIHAMSDEQDMRKMGNLWKKIPYTYALMWVGSLSIAGIFPFAGYFSKDSIIEYAYAKNTAISEYAYSMGLTAAVCTAFYTFRLIYLTFHGKERYSSVVARKIHESPKVMLWPLVVLAFGSVFAGFTGDYFFDIVGSKSNVFWGESIFVLPKNNLVNLVHSIDLNVKLMPSVCAVLGILIVYFLYIYRPVMLEFLKNKFGFLYDILLNKYYFDEIYDVLFVSKFKKLSEYLKEVFEFKVIDGCGPMGVSSLSKKISGYISRAQSGFVYNYATVMLLGVIVLISLYFIVY